MRKREKSVLNFAEAMPCGHVNVTFHTWEHHDHEQVLRRLAQLGCTWDGPPRSGERAVWLQGTIGPLQVTVFLPLDVELQPSAYQQPQQKAA